MVAQNVFFYAIAAVIVFSALRVVTSKNVVHAALYLVAVLAGVGAQYVLLTAEFVAATQVLVYIGAISILILFAIMLTQTKVGPAKLVFHHQAWAAALAAVVLAVIFAVVVIATAWPVVEGPVVATTQAIAKLLFQDYLLAFEVISVLLLAAVIGGVFLAKREETETEDSGVDLTNPPALPPLPIVPPALASSTGTRSQMSRTAEEP
jgi:NADH-quinone oxidoreductase subunit J